MLSIMFHILPNSSNLGKREGQKETIFIQVKNSFAWGFLTYHFLLSNYKGKIELDLEICLILRYNLMSNCNKCHVIAQICQL